MLRALNLAHDNDVASPRGVQGNTVVPYTSFPSRYHGPEALEGTVAAGSANAKNASQTQLHTEGPCTSTRSGTSRTPSRPSRPARQGRNEEGKWKQKIRNGNTRGFLLCAYAPCGEARRPEFQCRIDTQDGFRCTHTGRRIVRVRPQKETEVSEAEYALASWCVQIERRVCLRR